MNTESKQQIAREATTQVKDWMEIDTNPWLPVEIEKCTEIILSAIERSHTITISECPLLDGPKIIRPQPDDRVEKALQDYDEGKALDTLAAERSEQQEWTPEYVEKLVGVQARRIDYTRIAHRIADAHNAALTDERQRRAQSEAWLEEKRNESAIFQQDCSKYYNRLLAALAVIEKKNAKLMELIQFHISGDPCHVLETVALQPDLSLLHEHDAEVRKPLVDALEEINEWVLWIKEPLLRDEDKRAAKVAGIIDDALAKVKQS